MCSMLDLMKKAIMIIMKKPKHYFKVNLDIFLYKICKGRNRDKELEKKTFGISKNKQNLKNYDLIKGNLIKETKIVSLIDAKAKINNHLKCASRKDNKYINH